MITKSKLVRIAVAVAVVVVMGGSVLSATNTIDQRDLVQANEETQRQLREYVACTAAWDDANNARSRTLTPATGAERDAEREAFARLFGFVDALALGEGHEPEQLASFAALRNAGVEVRSAWQQADKARSANPILEPVSVACADPAHPRLPVSPSPTPAPAPSPTGR